MPRRLWPALPFLFLILTAALYLGYVAWLGAEIAFPLDDSWIHQTFARNLVERGEFAYNLGEPSTASTSPLWTILLAVGYVFPGASRAWAYILGMLFLGFTSVVGYHLTRELFPKRPGLALVSSLAILLEWRLDWAALSGMETILFAFLCLSALYLATLALKGKLSPARICLLGAVSGLATVVRPEGIALAVLCLGTAIPHQRPRRWAFLSLGISLVVVLPLVIFNVVQAGSPLPSTYYAKNAAYAQPFSLVFALSYLVGAIGTLSEGPLALLLPGVVYTGYSVVKRLWVQPSLLASLIGRPLDVERGKRGDSFASKKQAVSGMEIGCVAAFILIGLWVVAMLGMYMLRLPALFHHGRYLMPLIPPLVVVGVGGLAGLSETVPFRLLPRVYGILAALVFLVLWVNGAVVYAWDVKFIDDEQVATARWLAGNVPAEALVATHDIGAIGYFSGKTIVDTAGLITPELAPYVKDETKIADYLAKRRIDYLAVFPKWYPRITADSRLEEVFKVSQPYAAQFGADNMVIYRANWQ